MLYERILVGTDGSSTAAKAVDRAVEIGKVTGAAVTVLHVGSGAKGEKVLQAVASRYAGSDVAVTTEMRSGDPASVLADAADGYDLLVVGNKGMTGAARFFLGSVPNKVSHHARLSLMIVHTT